MNCSVETCEKAVCARGWCKRHYQQVSKYGRVLTDEEVKSHFAKKKGVRLNTGRTHFKKGKPSWNKGISDWLSLEHKEKLKIVNSSRAPWNKGMEIIEMMGANNPMWAGDNVGYRTLHKWVERHLGKPSTCAFCQKENLTARQIHWANLSHKYKRSKDDWMRLCAKCHKAYDTGKLTLAELRG